MSAEFFLDTNVLIYVFSEQDALKKIRSQELHKLALIDRRGMISFQVVQEWPNTAISKIPGQFAAGELQDFLDIVLWPLCEIFPSAELYAQALRLHAENGYSFYDSLMVAAALEAGCQTIFRSFATQLQSAWTRN